MIKSAKQLAHQINKNLDEIGAPANMRERSIVLSKILDISKQQAWSLLEGAMLPDDDLLQQVADELEIDISHLKKD